jgi:hypothetical protein
VVYEVTSRKDPYSGYTPSEISLLVANKSITLEPENFPEISELMKHCMKFDASVCSYKILSDIL